MMKDYTGKLNDRKDYLEIINKIKKVCEYIEIVVIDCNDSNELVDKLKSDVISVKKVKEWWGTELDSDTPINNLYKIKSSNELFEYLSNVETFCKYYEYGTTKKSYEYGDYVEKTNFGLDDIAFYDKNDNCLLWTTTHEGYIMINDILLK